jgi:hypothetical protein
MNINGEHSMIVMKFGATFDSVLSRKSVGVPGFHHYEVLTVRLHDGTVKTVYFQEWSAPPVAGRLSFRETLS